MAGVPSSSSSVTRSLREWETLLVGNGGLPERDSRLLHTAAEHAARHLGLPETAVLTRTYQGLKAGQVVGVLAVHGRTLEILPKIDGGDGSVRAALVRMLSVAWDLRVTEGELAILQTQKDDLLELLIRLFADRLLAAVRRGMPRRYLLLEEDRGLLRGSLDIKRQFTHLAMRPDRLACRYDELSEDAPLNRVLKAAVTLLNGVTRSLANARRLAELIARLEPVRDSHDPLRESVRLDRTNTAFHDLYRLARLFLTGDWQDTTGGHSVGFALLFPMNELFERFIGLSLRHALAPRAVHLQDRRRYALLGEQNEPIFALRPDVVVDNSDERPIVIDSKWKRLSSHNSVRGKTLDVAEADVYQMLAYSRAYRAKRLVLIYPWHEEMNTSQGVSRRWFVSGTDCRLDVATVDVGRPYEVEKVLCNICELG